MLSRLAQRITDHPRRFLIGAVIFLVVAITVGTPVTGLLSSGNADDFVDPSGESTLTSAHLENRLGRTLSPAIIVLVRADTPVLGGPGLRKVRRVVDVLAKDEAVARMVSLLGVATPATTGNLTATAAHAPAGKVNPLVSRDGKATYVAAYLRTGADQTDAGERITAALRTIHGVTVGGYAVAVPQVSDQVSKDLAAAETLAFPLLFLLSLLIFRGAVAALLPLFVGLLTIMGTFLGLRHRQRGRAAVDLRPEPHDRPRIRGSRSTTRCSSCRAIARRWSGPARAARR